jgi:ribosome-binding protein aMBF1 (putative translation factor)
MPSQSFQSYVADLEADEEEAKALAYARARAALGRRVRLLRDAAGRTQRELAASANVTQADVSRIESGQANPTIETLSRIGVSLGVELDYRAPSEV